MKYNYRRSATLVALSLALAGALVTACAPANAEQGWQPYFDVGAGVQLDGSGPEGYDSKDSPTAHFALGMINPDETWRVELSHESNWLIGWPVNDKPELHRTEVRLVRRFYFGGGGK